MKQHIPAVSVTGIDNVTGKITVLNSTGDEIFTSNIRDLSSQDGRYYLKYSDFENKNFGNQITVVYGDGNERGGNTIVKIRSGKDDGTAGKGALIGVEESFALSCTNDQFLCS